MDASYIKFGLFLVGMGTGVGVSFIYLKRLIRGIEQAHAEKVALMQGEQRLAEEALKLKLEAESAALRQALERAQQAREMEVRGREEEAMNALMTAEKERETMERRRGEYESKLEALEERGEALRAEMRAYREKLYELSQMNRDQVRALVLAEAERELEAEVSALREERLGRTEKEVQEEARKILLAAMQRLSAVPHEDVTATMVAIPSDDMKGRIIGREGRNIKSFETLTGTTLLIDETPDSVLVSSFDPVRREVARIALEALIKDGRIHPASIEAAVRTAETEVSQSVVETGESTLRRLRLSRMHPEVVSAIGQMRFRLSNNQNLLEHSIEVAQLASLIAAELGLDTQLAKRAGLLHDIGKVLDHEHEGSHARVGSYFLKRIGQEDERVINAVAAHHEEIAASSPYVALVMIADSLSALRPGARADSLDGYIHRIKSLEGIARSIEGVVDTFAIQAGREIRIIVAPEQVSEKGASVLARRVRRQIEDELQYPGTIKVTVIREQRFEETAK